VVKFILLREVFSKLRDIIYKDELSLLEFSVPKLVGFVLVFYGLFAVVELLV
jgi:hypothetical protein